MPGFFLRYADIRMAKKIISGAEAAAEIIAREFRRIIPPLLLQRGKVL
jgi:hypothetical protein